MFTRGRKERRKKGEEAGEGGREEGVNRTKLFLKNSEGSLIVYPFSKIILAEPITSLATSSWTGLQNTACVSHCESGLKSN